MSQITFQLCNICLFGAEQADTLTKKRRATRLQQPTSSAHARARDCSELQESSSSVTAAPRSNTAEIIAPDDAESCIRPRRRSQQAGLRRFSRARTRVWPPWHAAAAQAALARGLSPSRRVKPESTIHPRAEAACPDPTRPSPCPTCRKTHGHANSKRTCLHVCVCLCVCVCVCVCAVSILQTMGCTHHPFLHSKSF